MEDIILCEYGCGQKASFKTKGGKNICSQSPNKCPINRRKNSQGSKIIRTKSPEKWIGLKKGGMVSKQWRQNNPGKYLQGLQKHGKTHSQNLKQRKTFVGRNNPFYGKTHTKRTKEKMSNASLNWKTMNGIRTRYYPVYCPYMKQTIKVQGTWQLKYAEYLNQNKINWIRSRKINLKYRLHQDDYLHTYYPDFYLPDKDQYVEIKGYYPTQNEAKMNKVFQYNKSKTITILFKEELISIGIEVI